MWLCVAVVAVALATSYGQNDVQSRQFRLHGPFPAVLGRQDEEGYGTTVDYYARGCRECFDLQETAYVHPLACNIFIRCNEYDGQVDIYASECPPGTHFSEGQCKHANEVQCKENTGIYNGCSPGQTRPFSLNYCAAYYVCTESNTWMMQTCDAGTGFNLLTGMCDIPCGHSTRQYENLVCQEHPTDKLKYIVDAMVRDNGGPAQQVQEIRHCPADTEYVDQGSCSCSIVAKDTSCKDITLISFSSSDNSWARAKSEGFLMGNASITGPAVFAGKNTFSVPVLRGNDLGEYFEIQFDFQAGLTNAAGNIALADNSFCDIQPTYGCRLDTVGDGTGVVKCYISPSLPGYVLESSNMNLNSRISVYFARNGPDAILVTASAGSATSRDQKTVPLGVRALGNECPLSIGGGTGKNYFRGEIDNLYVRKYCQPFTPQV